MRIDATRFNLFWSNPEKYRLREIWKLAPKEPAAGTFASLLTYGRRRGTCFHEILDGQYRQVRPQTTMQELMDGGFDLKEINAAAKMVLAVEEKYPGEQYLAHEVTFEYPIPDSPHSMVGRIDHILKDDEGVIIGDWKTAKKRTKKEQAYKAEEYCRSAQVPFYLLGAKSLGFDTKRFLYRLVIDDPNGVEIQPHFTSRTGLELAGFARGVHQTCCLIEWMKQTFGVEQPWPQLAERFSSDYLLIMGRRMYRDYLPEGFEPKVEHLEILRETADGA